jgi:hypothetical protein
VSNWPTLAEIKRILSILIKSQRGDGVGGKSPDQKEDIEAEECCSKGRKFQTMGLQLFSQ